MVLQHNFAGRQSLFLPILQKDLLEVQNPINSGFIILLRVRLKKLAIF